MLAPVQGREAEPGPCSLNPQRADARVLRCLPGCRASPTPGIRQSRARVHAPSSGVSVGWTGRGCHSLRRAFCEGLEKGESSGFRQPSRDKVNLEGAPCVKERSPILQVCAAQLLGTGLGGSSLCFLLYHMPLCSTQWHSCALWFKCWDCLVTPRGSGQGGEGSSISLSCLERLRVFL